MANKLVTVVGVAVYLSAFAWVFEADAAGAAAKGAPAITDAQELEKLLEMSDLLDDMDRQEEFDAAMAQADSCIKSRDFGCAEAQLDRAAKAAKGAGDMNTMAAGRQSLANERQWAEAEAQRKAEEERIARAEREAREEARRNTVLQALGNALASVQNTQQQTADMIAAAQAEQWRRQAEQREQSRCHRSCNNVPKAVMKSVPPWG